MCVYICMYVYIYISLSLYIYIYIYVRNSETGGLLSTEERIVRDIIRLCCLCWTYLGFAYKLKLGAGLYETSSGLLETVSACTMF